MIIPAVLAGFTQVIRRTTGDTRLRYAVDDTGPFIRHAGSAILLGWMGCFYDGDHQRWYIVQVTYWFRFALGRLQLEETRQTTRSSHSHGNLSGCITPILGEWVCPSDRLTH